jgi:hypothetical protein
LDTSKENIFQCVECKKTFENEIRAVVEKDEQEDWCLNCFHKNFTDINQGKA